MVLNFEIIEKVGSNTYKLQLPGDMAISSTFNIGDLSPYVEDAIENPSRYYSQQKPSDLRSNPSEEGEVDAGALAKGTLGIPEDQQVKEDQHQGAIQALFSFTSSRACAVVETPFGGSNQGMIGRVLRCWTF